MPIAGMGEQFGALGAEKEEGGHVAGAREAVTGELEVDNL